MLLSFCNKSNAPRGVAIPPRDWQLLPLPSKQWATVSMIDTVWEKLTKVSDEVSELQVAVAQPPNEQTEMEEVRKALLELTEALQAQDHSLRGVEERLGILHAQPKDDHRMELEGLRRELQELRVGHEAACSFVAVFYVVSRRFIGLKHLKKVWSGCFFFFGVSGAACA